MSSPALKQELAYLSIQYRESCRLVRAAKAEIQAYEQLKKEIWDSHDIEVTILICPHPHSNTCEIWLSPAWSSQNIALISALRDWAWAPGRVRLAGKWWRITRPDGSASFDVSLPEDVNPLNQASGASA